MLWGFGLKGFVESRAYGDQGMGIGASTLMVPAGLRPTWVLSRYSERFRKHVMCEVVDLTWPDKRSPAPLSPARPDREPKAPSVFCRRCALALHPRRDLKRPLLTLSWGVPVCTASQAAQA